MCHYKNRFSILSKSIVSVLIIITGIMWQFRLVTCDMNISDLMRWLLQFVCPMVCCIGWVYYISHHCSHVQMYSTYSRLAVKLITKLQHTHVVLILAWRATCPDSRLADWLCAWSAWWRWVWDTVGMEDNVRFLVFQNVLLIDLTFYCFVLVF